MTTWKALVAAVAADNRAGATELTRRAGDALVHAARSGELLVAARAVVRAQPAMASLLNLASAALAGGDAGDVAGAVATFLERLEAGNAAAAERAAERIPEGASVLTISASSAVRLALLTAQRAGRQPRVLCLESRPVLEGRALALELAALGLPVVLAADAAVVRLATEADLALVGGDALTPDGLVNKLGSTALALAARAAGRPVYALCALAKFVARLPTGALDRGGASDEIAPPPLPSTLSVLNPYFEQTPLDLLGGIVTEQGLVEPKQARELAARQTLHPSLADLVTARKGRADPIASVE